MRPNVLLIVFDTARADAFEPYGAPPGSTPVTADLARRGAAVPLAISAANWTMPSHAAMFAGMLPRALGLSIPTDGGLLNPRKILEAHRGRLLAEVLRREGYRTVGVSCNPLISRGGGFATGFDEWADLPGEHIRRPKPGVLPRLRYYARATAARDDEGAGRARDVLRRALRDGPTKPFFWFVNLMECHTPYLPVRPFNDLSMVGRLRAADDAYRYQTAVAMVRYTLGDAEIPRSSLERMRHLYSRAVTMMDHWIGGLLEALDRARVLDDTIVIVTSDHGENIGDDHMLGHGRSLGQRLIHVPFVWAGPGAPPTQEPFGLPELPAVLADRLGIRDHPWTEPSAPPGMAVAQNDLTSFWTRDQVERLAATWGVPVDMVSESGPYAAILDGRFKLYRVAQTERLFDLQADPGELRDATADHPEVAARLRDRLDRVQLEHGTGDRALYTAQEQAEIEGHLEALGYL